MSATIHPSSVQHTSSYIFANQSLVSSYLSPINFSIGRKRGSLPIHPSSWNTPLYPHHLFIESDRGFPIHKTHTYAIDGYVGSALTSHTPTSFALLEHSLVEGSSLQKLPYLYHVPGTFQLTLYPPYSTLLLPIPQDRIISTHPSFSSLNRLH